MRKQLSALAAALLALAVLLPSALALPPASEPVMEGVDISVYQGHVDFVRLRDAGIQAVYIRASYGEDGVDADFRAHYDSARAAGLHLGFYHYLTAYTEAGAVAQADFFVSLLQDLDYDMRPALDFELDGLGRAQATAVASAFLQAVEARTGILPALYCDSDDANNLFEASMARWPLWVAQWGVETPDVTRNWTVWTGFQYTDQGLLPGVEGYVDRDRFTREILISSEEPQPRPLVDYTVRPGDTLWAIARRYGTTVSAIAAENDIPNPSLIYPGQVFRIPVGDTLYTIRPGDTLWSLARRFGTTVEALASLNRIQNPNLIYAGRTLIIPV